MSAKREVLIRWALSACPFCGDKDVELADSSVPKIEGRGPKQAVFCHGCFCEGPTADHESDAIELWNRRADETL